MTTINQAREAELAEQRAKRQVYEWCQRICAPSVVRFSDGSTKRLDPKKWAVSSRRVLESEGWEVTEHHDRYGDVLLTACRPIGGKDGE